MFPNVTINGVPDLSDLWPDLDARLAPDQPMVTMVNNVLTIHDPDTGVLVEQIDWSGNLPLISQLLKILSVVSKDGQITLNWTGNGQLQWAPTVQGPWTSITPMPESPYSEILLAGQTRFYRLQGL
jgi:hypothetical protein